MLFLILKDVAELSFLKDTKIGLIFLDIHTPRDNGIELLKVLIHSSLVIFTATYTGYRIESYEKYAVAYLLKTYDFRALPLK
ncbi:MAG: hypothetical protein DA407_14740 [Bacteroidetes bacterium]|nr:MAG: hypothetical protein DA407_14740 [Bacteroidota bacterium]